MWGHSLNDLLSHIKTTKKDTLERAKTVLIQMDACFWKDIKHWKAIVLVILKIRWKMVCKENSCANNINGKIFMKNKYVCLHHKKL